MKRVISLLLSVIMLFSITVGFDFCAYADDCIEIWNIEDLYKIRYNMDADYMLMTDIDMTVDTAAKGEFSYGGRGWEPIGSNGIYSDMEFTGNFYGNGHSIIGMNININDNLPAGVETDYYVGLFAKNSGIISDLKMVDCNININNSGYKCANCASIAAINYGTIVNCSSNGSIYGDDGFTGGIAGYNVGVIECCYNTANITYGYFVGGIAGRGEGEANILNCYNTGELVGSTSKGIACVYCKVNSSYSLTDGIGGTATDCYYLSGTGNSQNGAKELNESQMKKSYMYPGFDFNDIWIIDPDSDYPYPQLRSNRQSVSSENIKPSVDLENFKIKTVSLTLENSITMNYKVLKTAFTNFENPYIEFIRNGKKLTVANYTEQGDYYVFPYRDIAPQTMNDNVTAVLYATNNGIIYNSKPIDYSVSTYAYAMLEKCNSNQHARLRMLLVDLLNYGATAQIYQNYKVDNLVNAELTDEQKSWASTQQLNLTNIADKACDVIENPLVEWKSVGLQLNDSVAVRYKFSAQNIDNIKLKIICGKSEWIYTNENFIDNGDGTYTFLFNGLNADKMQKEIYITAMNGDAVVSNTMRYSVESYAKQIQDLMPDSKLRKLTDALMRYGISASNYI